MVMWGNKIVKALILQQEEGREREMEREGD